MRPSRLLTFWIAAMCLGCLSGRQKPDPRFLAAQALVHDLQGEVDVLRDELNVANRTLQTNSEKIALLESRLGERSPELPYLTEAGPSWFLEATTARWFEGPATDGFESNLPAYGRQVHAYVLTFWATWCGPCVSAEERRQLKYLHEELQRVGGTLIGVSVDDAETLMADPRASGWHYPIWQRKNAHIEWLPEGLVKSIGLSLPLFLVVDRSGRVRYYRNAVLNDDARRDLVTAVAATRPLIGRPEPEKKHSRLRHRR